MKVENKHTSRRNFLKVSMATAGGFMVGFNFIGCKNETAQVKVLKDLPSKWVDFDAYIKIGDTGWVTILSQNPEIGQNIKTSMPMIVAEELDVSWSDVMVEQAPLNTEWYERQVAGGSQSIRQGWNTLRTAGAKVRHMLIAAAAQQWEVDPKDCTTSEGKVIHGEQSLTYGELAEAAGKMTAPEEVKLKDPKDFKIIGKSQTNVDMDGVLTGKPLFGLDYKKEGMVYAVVLRPPAFGQVLETVDDAEARKVNGVIDVVQFGDKVAVIGNNTWAAMKGKKALKAKWNQKDKAEDSAYHTQVLMEHLQKKTKEAKREDGNVEKAFAEADQIIERTYEAPFLPHNCMEPMNFFAEVTDEKVQLVGPIQTPAWTESRIADLLKRDAKDIHIEMTRMGGGFGRRLYGDFALEAAEISSLIKKPVKVVYSREDDMLAGIYRPASAYRFKAAIKNNELTGYHLTEAFFNGSMFGDMPSNFPCGAVENYRVDCHNIKSNVTTGAWRAPYANFLAYAEQAFIDELAETMNKDAVDFRIALLEKAKANPVGEKHNYEADKFIGVIKLAAEKSGWYQKENKHLGFSAYYSHNTYVAEVAEIKMNGDRAELEQITCAVDCGIVVNPIGAENQIEGGIIDGIGHALYGEFNFTEGHAESNNFHQYRLIRMGESPKVAIHFVESTNDPTGLGEPTLPPAGGALANALHAATKQRLYKQPFMKELKVLG